jgi:hypothetical protein
MNMRPDTAPEQPDDDAPVEAGSASASAAPVQPTPAPPVAPTQSSEDTDVGWGDYRDRDDDDHLLRDRPPHWDNT